MTRDKDDIKAFAKAFRGVPHAIAIDGWWLDAPAPGGTAQGAGGGAATPPGGTLARRAKSTGAMLLVIAAADLLFWRHAPGVSVVLFAAVIFAVALRDLPAARLRRPALLLALAALPAVDHVQALSLAFLALGLAGALVLARHPEAPLPRLAQGAAQLLARLPRGWLAQIRPRGRAPRTAALRAELGAGLGAAPGLRSLVRNWAFPLGGGLVLVSLLMDANPVLARLLTLRFDLWEAAQRGVFWAGTAILVAPLLIPAPLPDGAPRAHLPRLPGLGLNAGSVLRALGLFNLLLGVQSLTDLSILIGGADLPAGMSMAEYAHRGAYPLLITAILAGAFAVAARPFLAEHRAMTPLLYLWLAQNMVLCGAAALRLDLYIGAFGLTYLRLYALIWMALVAAGLGLVLWQVARGRPNLWLIGRGAALGLGTLYLCSFVNFAQLIAAQNVTRARPDLDYLCALGPMAAGPIVESGLGQSEDRWIDLGPCAIELPWAPDWQEWGFRSWAVTRYVLRIELREWVQ